MWLIPFKLIRLLYRKISFLCSKINELLPELNDEYTKISEMRVFLNYDYQLFQSQKICAILESNDKLQIYVSSNWFAERSIQAHSNIANQKSKEGSYIAYHYLDKNFVFTTAQTPKDVFVTIEKPEITKNDPIENIPNTIAIEKPRSISKQNDSENEVESSDESMSDAGKSEEKNSDEEANNLEDLAHSSRKEQQASKVESIEKLEEVKTDSQPINNEKQEQSNEEKADELKEPKLSKSQKRRNKKKRKNRDKTYSMDSSAPKEYEPSDATWSHELTK